MDPTANLKSQLAVARAIIAKIDGTHDDTVPLVLNANRLAELVLALDQWLARGGFLPEQWRR